MLQTFNGFCRSFCEKRQIWVSKSNFAEVRGDAQLWLMARWKAHGQLSIRVNWTFLAIYYGSGVEAKCVQLGCFHRGSTSLHSNFTCTGSYPSTILGIIKLENLFTRRWRLHSCAFPRMDTTPECDGQTDRQTDRRICRSIYSCLQN